MPGTNCKEKYRALNSTFCYLLSVTFRGHDILRLFFIIFFKFFTKNVKSTLSYFALNMRIYGRTLTMSQLFLKIFYVDKKPSNLFSLLNSSARPSASPLFLFSARWDAGSISPLVILGVRATVSQACPCKRGCT